MIERHEVIEQFVEYILPAVRETYEQDGIIDVPARREAFNNYTDALCKDGIISDDLYNDICLPDELETKY